MKIEIKLRIAAADGSICEEEILNLDKWYPGLASNNSAPQSETKMAA